MVSPTEENYLKAIYKICETVQKAASTNAIAKEMQTSAASVTDMLKRLSEKALIHYEKYKGVSLTKEGTKMATTLIRSHRLWEVFLVNKLSFTWDEVHDIAEQLEHIKSNLLIERLDQYLGQPKFDPHGDPIPDANGNFTYRNQIALSELKISTSGVVVGVQEHSKAFLQYLDKMHLGLGARIEILEKFEYDASVKIKIENHETINITNKVAQNLFVQLD